MAGWFFVSPAFIGLLIFLVLPILIMAWASTRDWNGISPISDAGPAGLDNYRALLTESGIRQRDFGLSLRNNLFYVLGVVPAQTFLALWLAMLVNQRQLKGKTFFRSAFYIPSVTGSVAMALVFTFLFTGDGFINSVLPGPAVKWLNDPRGIFHLALEKIGLGPFAEGGGPLGLSWWEWFSGPSVTMVAVMILVVWQTTGTMMLIFLGALQEISPSIDEATEIDGASPKQRMWHVTIPILRPSIAFVITLGVIYTWQVFDQVFVITAGGPLKTTITPAYLLYFQMFSNTDGGSAAAIAMLLFVLIISFALLQRRLNRTRS
ncbi:MAG: carbohydrate ABC transporter permease [Actinomycetota bacterium]